MRILDNIRNIFSNSNRMLTRGFGYSFGAISLSRLEFARVVFINICELLTDLTNDVSFTLKSGDAELFGKFRAFFEMNGQFVLNKLFMEGFVVVHNDVVGLRILNDNEYRVQSTKNGAMKVVPVDVNADIYVMKSETFEIIGKSDECFLNSWLTYLNNVLNSSNTISERLGALVVASPKNASTAPTTLVLNKEQKDALEKDIQNEYGSLSSQKSIIVLPREMQFDTISLSSLDIKTAEKARLAILAICDRIKVPSNQVAIIDANSSKSLSNGSELKEGDFNKYQSFERLLNRTFVRMAFDMGLNVDYTIYNKPVRVLQ